MDGPSASDRSTHGVHRAAHAGEERALRDERRVDAGLDLVGRARPAPSAGGAPGDREQLQRVAELAAPAEVLGLEARDPLGEDVARARSRAPNASWASTQSFCAASPPETSSVGSASA